MILIVWLTDEAIRYIPLSFVNHILLFSVKW